MTLKLVLETLFLIIAIMTALHSIITNQREYELSPWVWWVPAISFGAFWLTHNINW